LWPGDLVFMKGVQHVGLYAGGNRFIHAPRSGDVVKVSCLTGWYASAYVSTGSSARAESRLRSGERSGQLGKARDGVAPARHPKNRGHLDSPLMEAVAVVVAMEVLVFVIAFGSTLAVGWRAVVVAGLVIVLIFGVHCFRARESGPRLVVRLLAE
jgi:NlpC/P60 family